MLLPRGTLRFGLAASLAALAIGACADAFAQPKAYRIGWLSASSDATSGLGDFQQGMRDLRYVEGRDVVIEIRQSVGNPSRLGDLASQLAALPVDLIVTAGESPALAAKRATKTIPIVAIELAWDPVKAGLVGSLARPEGNVTGLATQSDELWPKRLGLLKQVAPQVKRVTALWNPGNPGNASCIAEINAGGATLDIDVQSVEARDAASLGRAFASIVAAPPDALAICWDAATLAQALPIAEFAARLRLPTVAALREYVDAGALLSYGPSLATQRRRAAYYVDRIIKGTKPSSLPVERPTQFDLVLNDGTARKLGIAFPAVILGTADDVIR